MMTADNHSLQCEHGLSIHINFNGQQILFDIGQSSKFLSNAAILKINAADINFAVLSHGHYDHGGGLATFIEANKQANIFMKYQATGNFYSKRSFIRKYIGLDQNLLKHPDISKRIVFIDKSSVASTLAINNKSNDNVIKTEQDAVYPLTENIYLLTKINKYTALPKADGNLFVKNSNKFTQDTFEHELVLVIKSSAGINVFSGCSHNGIINIIKTVKQVFPAENICSLIGGFHLSCRLGDIFTFSKTEANIVANMLINEDIEKIYTGHCTGNKAFLYLQAILGEKITALHTGMQIEI